VLVVDGELLVAGFEVVAAAAPPWLVVSFELDPHPTPTAAPSASAAITATARYEKTDHLWRSIIPPVGAGSTA
jgi:hypothetical protein